MKRTLTILCDLDAVVADLLKKWLGHYNRDFEDTVTSDDIIHWSIEKCLPKAGQKIFDYLYQEKFFLDLEPLPGAAEGLEALHEDGHRIIIATAHTYPGTSASDKVSWVRQHLPFLGKRHMMIGHQKQLLRGDVFIDDSPANLTNYREAWVDAPHQPKIMTIAYPYNESVKDLVDVYAEGYKDTAKAWGTIYRAIDSLSEAA